MTQILPLTGYRVVDLADEKGELAGRILADFGAEVIRVEPPKGARSRGLPPFAPSGKSLYFAYRNSNKLGHVLDLETDAGRAGLLDLLARAERLEATVGAVEIVLGHNDLLAANFIDDGNRLWLVDWEYAGFNSPLFDLGGLASNSEFPPDQAEQVLSLYFGRPVDDTLRRRAAAMTAASLLRETMWSMVSEIHSTVDFDYAAYTAENLRRFEAAYAAYLEMDPA